MPSEGPVCPAINTNETTRSSGNINVRPVEEADREKWDAFCAEHHAAYGSFYRWQAILEKTGRIPVFLLAERHDEIVGIFTICIFRVVSARRAVSTWGDGQTYGGPFVTDPEAIEPLLDEAEKTVARRGAASILTLPDPCQEHFTKVCEAYEARGYRGTTAGQPAGIHQMDDEQTEHIFRIPLPDDFETLWKRFDRDVRNRARKAEKNNVEVEEVDPDDFWKPYHDIQIQVWRRLGNKYPSSQRLIEIVQYVDEGLHTYLARFDDKIVGALYAIDAGRVRFLKGAISHDDYASLGVNNVTYTRAIKDAVKLGLEQCDMGLTPPPAQSGHHRWKKLYRGEIYPLLNYKRILRPAASAIDSAIARVQDRAARKFSYGHPALDALGPIGRAFLNWTRR
ncbi:GNAT family N-acetyltransferase [bacterium]|nr:GNAT family N-acetyltransferase [bacterium]